MLATPVQTGWRRGDAVDELVAREWLVTNGLGGYASGTIGGTCSRRFHGALVAALPAPLGRTMMLNHLEEWVTGMRADFLEEFVLECGLPVWRYSDGAIRIEKRLVMPHLQNTVYIVWTLLAGPASLTLHLRPSLKFRPHEGLLHEELPSTWKVDVDGSRIEISDGGTMHPPLRICVIGSGAQFAQLVREPRVVDNLIYDVERSRGYDHEGALWSPGRIDIPLVRDHAVGIVGSVESWDVVRAMTYREAMDAETERRMQLLARADAQDNFDGQLVLAADQFLIRPATRAKDEARVSATGDSPHTIIAGYHWFTDWGRDTMISLEGLTLTTKRYREAGSILRTFASYIRDGLIPNMFPEGEHGGLYHTADATMWFFHAVHRYVRATGDRETLRHLLPKLIGIIDAHVRGTLFNIHVDPSDGLLAQGAEGYQLTWMDAKVDDWVVTPRRGKAVEINALFYNALRIVQQYASEEGDGDTSRRMDELANKVRQSFNARFWYEEGQYLYDVLDPDDAALRPNQIFAISLDHPVLDRSRWKTIVDVVERELLTPVGLRSLARHHADYKSVYDGDLRSRDAAYHQGTVWGWLIGPFVDAWVKVHGRDGALKFLSGFEPHLGEACIGTISEIFDAEPPFTPRGCAAQAWSVAEVLRSLRSLRA